MNAPQELLYSKEHIWVKKEEDGSVLIGITDKAQKDLNAMVFVNFPMVGDSFNADDVMCDVESVKSVSDIYAPVNGTVSEINELLMDTPEAINNAPYEAWLCKMADVSGLEELMDADAYIAFCAE